MFAFVPFFLPISLRKLTMVLESILALAPRPEPTITAGARRVQKEYVTPNQKRNSYLYPRYERNLAMACSDMRCSDDFVNLFMLNVSHQYSSCPNSSFCRGHSRNVIATIY